MTAPRFAAAAPEGEEATLLERLGVTLSEPQLAVVAVALFALTYVLILLEQHVHRTVAALLGASGVMVLGVLTPREAWGAVDFNTLFLLFGMMCIVTVMGRSGLFDLAARRALRFTRGDPVRVLWTFSVLTAVFSAFLDNVTTVLFMAPALLSVVLRLKLPPVPYLVAIILASNTGGTATLVGDPPNIIIGSIADKSFADFLVNVAPFAAVAFFAGLGVTHLLLRRRGHLKGALDPAELKAVVETAPPPEVNPRLLRQSLWVFGVTVVLFVVGHGYGLEAGLVALTTGTFLMLIADLDPTEILHGVEWATLLFFIGLFVVVGGLEAVGVFSAVALRLTGLIGEDILAGILLVGFASALISGFVDNIPFTISMANVLRELEGTLGERADPLWWALSLGACLGGNLTLIGASANIVVADLAARAGHPISFARFLRYGTPVAAVTVTLALALYALVYALRG